MLQLHFCTTYAIKLGGYDWKSSFRSRIGLVCIQLHKKRGGNDLRHCLSICPYYLYIRIQLPLIHSLFNQPPEVLLHHILIFMVCRSKPLILRRKHLHRHLPSLQKPVDMDRQQILTRQYIRLPCLTVPEELPEPFFQQLHILLRQPPHIHRDKCLRIQHDSIRRCPVLRLLDILRLMHRLQHQVIVYLTDSASHSTVF